MKLILGALGAITLIMGFAAAQPADARCMSNGRVIECVHPMMHHHFWQHRHFYRHD